MRLPWGGIEAEAIGAWDRLAAAVRDFARDLDHQPRDPGHRLARPDRPRPRSLGHGNGTEIHLVLSVRDLVRQIPAEWQENVKHRAALTYGAVPRPDPGPRARGPDPTWFWGVQEIPDILDRWGHDLPPEQVHLVTVPPAGGSPDLLWSGSARRSGSTASPSSSTASGSTRRSASPRPR